MASIRHAFCPACDRYVGSVNICPYCDTPQPLSSRLVRRIGLALAIVGCVLMGLGARRHKPTHLDSDQVTSWMNGAYVYIVGQVKQTPAIRRGADGRDRLVFDVKDDAGRFHIVCPDQVAQQMIDAGQLPEKDTHVRASGTLFVGADGIGHLRCRDISSALVQFGEEDRHE